MSKDLVLRMTIPVHPRADLDTFDIGAGITFRQWLPLASEQSIAVSENRMSLTFWINMDCVSHVSDIQESDIPNRMNINLGKIFADVKETEVPDDLADFIAHTDYYRRSPDEH